MQPSLVDDDENISSCVPAHPVRTRKTGDCPTADSRGNAYGLLLVTADLAEGLPVPVGLLGARFLNSCRYYRLR